MHLKKKLKNLALSLSDEKLKEAFDHLKSLQIIKKKLRMKIYLRLLQKFKQTALNVDKYELEIFQVQYGSKIFQQQQLH